MNDQAQQLAQHLIDYADTVYCDGQNVWRFEKDGHIVAAVPNPAFATTPLWLAVNYAVSEEAFSGDYDHPHQEYGIPYHRNTKPVSDLIYETPKAPILSTSVGRLTKRGRALEDGATLVKRWAAAIGTFEHRARRDGDTYVLETVTNGVVTKAQPAATLVDALDLMHQIAPQTQWKIVEAKQKTATAAFASVTA